MANGPPTPDFTSRELRDALGCFATGITVVTTREPDGRPLGVTVNSFASVSLTPPLVSFCLDRGAFSFTGFVETPYFAINVLGEDQQSVSAAFARSTQEDKFVGVMHRSGITGSPLVGDSLCSLECERLQSFDAGDHVILLGRVLHIEATRRGNPLLYFRGRYARLEPGETGSGS